MRKIGQELLATKEDLAVALCVSTQTIGNLLKSKKIPPPDAKIGVTDCWFGPKYQQIAAMKDQLEQRRKEAQSAGGTWGMATRYPKAKKKASGR